MWSNEGDRFILGEFVFMVTHDGYRLRLSLG